MLDHGGNLGRIALTTPWPHSPRTPRECSILRRIEINPFPLVLSYLHHRANNPSSTRVSHILSTTMHDDPPPIVFEPRKRMRKTIASRDIPEEYARGKRYLCTRRMRHLIVTRESSIESRNWPALREQKKKSRIPHYPSIIVVFNFVLAPKSSEEGTSQLFPPFFLPILRPFLSPSPSVLTLLLSRKRGGN